MLYDLNFTKSVTLTCLVLQQLVANHEILELLITDEDQTVVQSNQWKALNAMSQPDIDF